MQRSHIFLLCFLTAIAVSTPARSEPALLASRFTLQVASFPTRQAAEALVSRLTRDGVSPIWGSINIPGRGVWFRVYLGEFETVHQARAEGESLVARRIIKEFLVKSTNEIAQLGRARRLAGKSEYAERYTARPARSAFRSKEVPALTSGSKAVSLPVNTRVIASFAPFVDTPPVPRPDPVNLAFRIVAGEESGRKRGGLWLSGDIDEALARLRWIVGEENAKLLEVEADGRLRLNAALLKDLVKAEAVDADAETLLLADYISSNEGLLLIVQMAEGPHRYLLHTGSKAPTFGQEICINGSINLDNNFDSRINPYRRGNLKLSQERPPAGFDAMVAINPEARWFNLRSKRVVPVGHITFHELAEAHAKVALGLDYLSHGVRPGAHNVALDREVALKSQRPESDIVLTAGSNRVLKSKQEIRQLFSDLSEIDGRQ
ncbi:MAG TPA: SPOR domain-containing protein [Blastocatellia bacterium]|nr:SPOR domain-containing protein [Blastocatellia bacterium]